jgi:tRNA (guanine37-N1)-methyltransferase
MELLAGEEDYVVLHKEGNLSFQFDIRLVYWCSRLQSERKRMLKKLKEKEVFCDAFCGVGPMAIQAAKKGLRVLANDLNPNCYEFINNNIKLNKVGKNITTFNMDAREFIRSCINQSKFYKDEEENYHNKFPVDLRINHIYMNLPKDALEFLDVFIGLFNNCKESIYNRDTLPIIHVYGFSNAQDPKVDLLNRVAQAFGIEKYDDALLLDLCNVRDVSTKKHMFCLSLKIPIEVALKRNNSVLNN